VDFKFTPRALGARHIGLGADNAFAANTSASRLLMTYKQRAQIITLIDPSPCIIQNGLEHMYNEHVHDIRIPEDATILETVPYLHGVTSKKIVFYLNEKEGVVDILEVPLSYTGNGKTGFVYEFNNEVNLKPNVYVKADTVIAAPPSAKYMDEYNPGVDLMTAVMSLPETAEDGIVLSEKAVDKFSFMLVEKRRIAVGLYQEPVILGTYGGNDYVVPDIGMRVNEDGVLMAIRNFNNPYCHVSMHAESMREIDNITDTVYQLTKGGGVVTDIEVIRGRTRTHTPICSQLDELADQNLAYLHRIIKAYNKLKQQAYKFSEAANGFITKAILITRSAPSGSNSIKLNTNKKEVPPFLVTITTATKYKPPLGSKQSDRWSAKGVTVNIWPESKMPVDRYGRRAEAIVSREAGTNRNIVGRDHARLITDCIVAAKEEVYKLVGIDKELTNYNRAIGLARRVLRDRSKWNSVYSILYHIYSLVNKAQAEELEALAVDHAEMEILLADVFTRGIIVSLPVDVVAAGNELDSDHSKALGPIPIVQNLINSPFYRKPGPVMSDDGTIGTSEPVRISPIYYLLLDKLSLTSSATNSPYLQIRGIPVISGKVDRETSMLPNSPVKVFGNDEAILVSGVLSPEDMALYLRDLQSIEYNAEFTRRSLQTGEAYPYISDEDVPISSSRGTKLIKHVFTAMGVDLRWEPNDE